MSSLAVLWRDPSFRAALRLVLDLRADNLETLRRLTSSGFAIPPTALKDFGLNTGEAGLALAALATTYGIVQEEVRSPEAALEELFELARNEPDLTATVNDWITRRPALLALLQPRPEYDRATRRAAILGQALPTLERVSLVADLRVVDYEGKRRLVPGILARFFVDEPIAGSTAIALQLTEDSLAQLKEQIGKIEETIGQLTADFGEHLL